MSTLRRLFAAGALVLAAGAIFAGGIAYQRATSEPTHIALEPHPFRTLHPATSPVWMEEHFPGPNGRDLAVRTHYRNSGEVGLKIFGRNNVVATETIWTADQRVRLHAEYAADGRQVISGFELRPNGTKLWEASNSEGVVTKTTYWVDGTSVFSVERRAPGALPATAEVHYFTQSGKRWMDYTGTAARNVAEYVSRAQTLEAWSDADVHTVSISMNGDNALVSIYGSEGKLSHVQEWVPSSYGWFDDGVRERRLRKVTVYSPEGKIVRVIELIGNSVTVVTEIAADGSRVAYGFTPWGAPRDAIRYNAEGGQIGTIEAKDVHLTFDRAVVQAPELPDVLNAWRDRERGAPTQPVMPSP